MKEIIKIVENEGIKTVNARELHEFLEVRTKFNDWLNQRVKKYDFIENVDFIAVTEKKVTAQGNKSEYKSYHISIDMAKELSMVENNDKGREARRYFINCEKKLNDIHKKLLSTDDLSDEMIIQKAMELQKQKIKTLSIKAQVADEIANSCGLYLPSLVGKMIMGRPNLFCQWLVDERIMYRKGSSSLLVPMSPYDQKEKDYFKIKTSVVKGKSTVTQTYFTPNGLCWIQARYLKKTGMLSLDYSVNVLEG